jgi:hypothetical protein
METFYMKNIFWASGKTATRRRRIRTRGNAANGCFFKPCGVPLKRIAPLQER